jgi:hypothetical protein
MLRVGTRGNWWRYFGIPTLLLYIFQHTEDRHAPEPSFRCSLYPCDVALKRPHVHKAVRTVIPVHLVQTPDRHYERTRSNSLEAWRVNDVTLNSSD